MLSGARLGTVTPNWCVADRPPESRAVTMIVALPPATPVTVTAVPDTAAVARVGSDETAA